MIVFNGFVRKIQKNLALLLFKKVRKQRHICKESSWQETTPNILANYDQRTENQRHFFCPESESWLTDSADIVFFLWKQREVVPGLLGSLGSLGSPSKRSAVGTDNKCMFGIQSIWYCQETQRKRVENARVSDQLSSSTLFCKPNRITVTFEPPYSLQVAMKFCL